MVPTTPRSEQLRAHALDQLAAPSARRGRLSGRPDARR
jgi:hypothetical protein